MAGLNSLSTDWDKFYQIIGGGPTGTAGGKPLKKDPGYIPPVPSSPLISHPVQTYKIDGNGNPIFGDAPSVPSVPSPRTVGSAFTGGWGSAPKTWQQQFTATTGQPLTPTPGPSQSLFDFLGGAVTPRQKPATLVSEPVRDVPKTTAQLPSGAPGQDWLSAYMTGIAPGGARAPRQAAVAAIDQATMPLPASQRWGWKSPFFPMGSTIFDAIGGSQPSVPSVPKGYATTGQTLPGATNFDGSPVQILTKDGKPKPKPIAPYGQGAAAWTAYNRARKPITYDQGRVSPGSGQEINGVDIAFMPKSVQESSRWRTGY